MQILPLMNDIGTTYFLTVFTGNAGKFICDFTSAWRRLPSDVRENILKYWGDSQFPVSFELSNFWKDCKKKLANAGGMGCELKFNSDDFDIMPSEVAQYVIAHELAHVYQYSAKLIADREYDYEGSANKLAEGWGFDHITEILWRAEHQNKSEN